VRLFPEITHLLELLDGNLSRLIGGFAATDDVASRPDITFFGAAFVFADFNQPGHELEKQVCLLNQIAAGLGQRRKTIHRFF